MSAIAGGFQLQNKGKGSYLVLKNNETGITDEEWSTVWGTSAVVRNHYRWLRLQLFDTTNTCTIILHLRIYDDGFAFRYEMPDDSLKLNIMREQSSLQFAEDGICWWSWADYHTLEKTYQSTSVHQATHVALPFTANTGKGYLSILEAELDDYPMMTLKRNSVDSLRFDVNLCPWADGVAVKTNGPFKTPWRAVIITGEATGLLNSQMVLNLNPPCALKDVSWINPIRACGIWWEMHIGLSTWHQRGGRHGATTANAIKHIDFAARHGLEGVLIEGWNRGWEYWGQRGAFDFTTAYPDFDLEEIAGYAKSKGVQLIGHHETGGDLPTYESRLDSAFTLYRNLGVRYVKTGYAGPMQPPEENHHGQYMVRHLNKVMRKAAEYGIMLDVHEPVIPSGLSRTYPNLMTFEAVRGMEWNAWSEGNPPGHDCILPFTRGLAGPMDYTPAIFDILLQHRQSERVRWNGLDKGTSRVHSTICHQLALPVIFYSPIQFYADLPENYEDHSLFDVLKSIPATWDESRFLAAEPGGYLMVARRKENRWFIAGITDENSREMIIPESFINEKQIKRAVLYRDDKDAHFETRPESFAVEECNAERLRTVPVTIRPGGGFLCVLEVE